MDPNDPLPPQQPLMATAELEWSRFTGLLKIEGIARVDLRSTAPVPSTLGCNWDQN